MTNRQASYITAAYLAWLAAIIFTACYFMDANAKVSTKVTPPKSQIYKSGFVDVVGVRDNRDGSATVVIDACGSKIEVTADKEDVELQNPQIQNQAQEAILKACKP